MADSSWDSSWDDWSSWNDGGSSSWRGDDSSWAGNQPKNSSWTENDTAWREKRSREDDGDKQQGKKGGEAKKTGKGRRQGGGRDGFKDDWSNRKRLLLFQADKEKKQALNELKEELLEEMASELAQQKQSAQEALEMAVLSRQRVHGENYNSEMQAMAENHLATKCGMVFWYEAYGKAEEQAASTAQLVVVEQAEATAQAEALQAELSDQTRALRNFEEGTLLARLAIEAAGEARLEEQGAEYRAAMDAREAAHISTVAALTDRKKHYKNLLRQKWEQAQELSSRLAEIESILNRSRGTPQAGP